jgi:hypothetical protein
MALIDLEEAHGKVPIEILRKEIENRYKFNTNWRYYKPLQKEHYKNKNRK